MQKKIIITSKSSWFDVGIKEVWLYRDLWSMLIKRDFIAMYKQTIMGPIWYLVQPVVTIIIFSLVFSRIGNISTQGLPAPIFYLTGLSLWGYFADCVIKVSSVFRDNQHIIGKVYFPRLIIPLSIVVSALVKYLIQIILIVCMIFFYDMDLNNIELFISKGVALILITLITCFLGLGFGLIVASISSRYRDFGLLSIIGIQLGLYVTPVIYSLGSVPQGMRVFFEFNPMSSLIEAMRWIFLSVSDVDITSVLLSAGVSLIVLFTGLLLFNQTQRSVIDTI